jgi:hypothetical protein
MMGAMTPESFSDLLFVLSCGVLATGCGTDGNAPGSGGGGSDVQAAISACSGWAQHYTECTDSPEFNYLTALGYCIANLGYAEAAGPDCRAAYEDYFACISEVDCEALFGGGGFDEPPSESFPCTDEERALEQHCS